MRNMASQSSRVTGAATLQAMADSHTSREQGRPSACPARGLPDRLMTGIEQLSGLPMGDVRVHYDSRQAARVRALAYTQGSEIHLGPGQERHLPHEAWHVVQQKQGRVKPTGRVSGRALNEDSSLEREADRMGERAARYSGGAGPISAESRPRPEVLQRRVGFEFETQAHIARTNHGYEEVVPDETKIYRGNNWTLVSDSGRMEFVSDPMANLAAHVPIVGEMANFINAAGVTRQTDLRGLMPGNWLPAAVGAPGNAVHTARDVLLTHDVGQTTFYGNPQVSVGVRMESLAGFLGSLRTQQPMRALRNKLHRDVIGGAGADPLAPRVDHATVGRMGKLLGRQELHRTRGVQQKAERLVQRNVAGVQYNGLPVPVADLRKLRGLWRLMSRYWIDLLRYQGMGGGYIKSKLPVMARTDFHSMFNDLGPQGQAAFQAARADFIGLNIPTGGGGGPLVAGHAFTIGDWYDSIANPTSQAVTPRHTNGGVARDVDLVSDDQTVAIGTNKSMGQLAMDPTGGVQRAVFELRHITGGVRINIGDMPALVLAPVFNLLNQVQA